MYLCFIRDASKQNRENVNIDTLPQVYKFSLPSHLLKTCGHQECLEFSFPSRSSLRTVHKLVLSEYNTRYLVLIDNSPLSPDISPNQIQSA